ncbi:MAG: YbjN domain-containing protein [Deltaproteobacteria bacterium]|jgi:hypothetical protein|nr:YbjN domain-containing protein [Deltaproteobacteria bacterium]
MRPKPALRALLTGLAIALAAFLSAGQTASAGGRIWESITIGEFLHIMNSEGLTAEIIAAEDGTQFIRWTIDGLVSTISFNNDNMLLAFYTASADTFSSLEEMNQWNRSHRLSRAYIDEDGDPCLESDLDFEGGILEDRIKDWLASVQRSVQGWKEDVLDRVR